MSEAEESNLHTYLDELNEMIRLNRSYYRKVEQLCTSISDLYSEISTKMYKLGSLYSKIGDNAKTIEMYCFSNLKDSFKMSEGYDKLRTGFFSVSNMLKKPSNVYTNLVKPLCKKSIADYQGIYDVRLAHQMLKLRSDLQKSYDSTNKKAVSRGAGESPGPGRSSSTKDRDVSSPDQPDLLKKENKLLNLNFKVYSEFVHTYRLTAADYHAELHKFASSMNGAATQDKKIWLEMLRQLKEEEKRHLEDVEKVNMLGEHV